MAQDDGPIGKPHVERLQKADVARTRLGLARISHRGDRRETPEI